MSQRFAQGSRSQLAVGVQSDFTTTATSFTNLPFSTHSLNMAKERLTGTDIQAHRMPTVDRHGARSVGGDITADLRHDEFDVLMQSALMSSSDFDTGFTAGDGSTTVTNAAILGTTPLFLSIEDYAEDVDQARLFTGCTVNSMSVSLAPNQMVTSTFGVVGRDMSISQTQKTVTASAGNQPFDSYSGDIKLGNAGVANLGSALTLITSLDFTLTNGFSPTMVVGENVASDLEFGTAALEGTITAYFEDETMINRFLQETESSLEVVVGDPESVARTLTFTMPRIKINSADVGVDGPTSRLVNMSFIALRDDTDLSSSTTDTNTLIKITKSAA